MFDQLSNTLDFPFARIGSMVLAFQEDDRTYLSRVFKTAYIEQRSPWENGYCESFNSKIRDEFLNGELFDTLQEAIILPGVL